MEVFVVAVLIGLLPASVASGKGRSFVLWWFFGAALFIVALPASLLIQPVNVKKCPHCAETIKGEARVCRHCGREVPVYPRDLIGY